MSQSDIKTRNPLLTIAAGRKGVGKTFTAIKMIDNYVKGNPAKGIVGRKVIILDINNEFSGVKRIDINDIKKFAVHPKIEARRVVVFKPNGTVKTLDELQGDLNIILTDFRGGLCMIEDVSRIMSDSVSMEFYGNICTQRHRNVDILLNVQSIKKVGHPKIFPNINVLRLHLTDDFAQRNRFEEKYEVIKIAESIIRNSAEYGQKLIRDIKRSNENWQTKPRLVKQIKDLENQYVRKFVYISFDNGDISGNFSKEEFEAAVFTYISENQDLTINRILKRIDEKGHFLYTKETAIAACKIELFDKYWGN